MRAAYLVSRNVVERLQAHFQFPIWSRIPYIIVKPLKRAILRNLLSILGSDRVLLPNDLRPTLYTAPTSSSPLSYLTNISLSSATSNSMASTGNKNLSVPKVLQFCKESRPEGLRHYKLDFATSKSLKGSSRLGKRRAALTVCSEAEIYINWKVDRVCVMESSNIYPPARDEIDSLLTLCKKNNLQFMAFPVDLKVVGEVNGEPRFGQKNNWELLAAEP
ncbi:uncharacterized protein PAC_05694 [Phialocephala subalpina]|uniref:2EXR domain-containing protein n=1 Tax=Phialocephala subalpina TaxID=576137 RepID=A0A1L7WSS9_9HELO|nr:uncharacterized protein PAC_05694 [Phialocephala subalpina]